MRTLCLVALAIAAVVAAPVAHAGDGIVLESYRGPRPEDANRLLAPILDELARRGFGAGTDVVGRRFEQRVSRPSMAEGLADRFGELVEQGHRAWIGGSFDQAIKVLAPVVAAAHANPGAFGQNQALRDKLLKALIALALSQQRVGDASARETFAEIVRSFPDAQLSRASYGPEAFARFEDIKKQALAAGRGRLAVKVSDDSAVVFVNERFQNVGSLAKTELPPGEYRVFAQVGKRLSRVHRVTVAANADATVAIDLDFDSVVHSAPLWTGFEFSDAEARGRLETVYAAAFANALDARGVVVVGIDQVRGRPAIVGTLVNLMTGRAIRRASIDLDPDPSADRLRTLGRFLGGDNAAPGIDIQIAGDAQSGPVGDGGVRIDDLGRSRGGPWAGWKYVTGGLAIAAVGVGAYYLSVDGDCADATCRDTALGGWIGIGSGAALGGISIYLFVRGAREPTRAAAIVPTPGGAYATVQGRF